MKPRRLMVGLGSPHGDDCVGWKVVEALRPQAPEGWELREVDHAAQFLDHLEEVETLVICDAVQGTGPVGSVGRWSWPLENEVPTWRASGSHDLGLLEVLSLAEHLGCLPAQVIIWGIEASASIVGSELSPVLAASLPQLIESVRRELCELACDA